MNIYSMIYQITIQTSLIKNLANISSTFGITLFRIVCFIKEIENHPFHIECQIMAL